MVRFLPALIVLVLFFPLLSSAETRLTVRVDPTYPYTFQPPGEYVFGANANSFYVTPNLNDAGANPEHGVIVDVNNHQISPAHWFQIQIDGPLQSVLTPGFYDNAASSETSTAPGLAISSGMLASCPVPIGHFTVFEITRDVDGRIISFAANFEQRCEHATSTGWIRGAVRFNSQSYPDPELSCELEGGEIPEGWPSVQEWYNSCEYSDCVASQAEYCCTWNNQPPNSYQGTQFEWIEECMTSGCDTGDIPEYCCTDSLGPPPDYQGTFEEWTEECFAETELPEGVVPPGQNHQQITDRIPGAQERSDALFGAIEDWLPTQDELAGQLQESIQGHIDAVIDDVANIGNLFQDQLSGPLQAIQSIMALIELINGGFDPGQQDVNFILDLIGNLGLGDLLENIGFNLGDLSANGQLAIQLPPGFPGELPDVIGDPPEGLPGPQPSFSNPVWDLFAFVMELRHYPEMITLEHRGQGGHIVDGLQRDLDRTLADASSAKQLLEDRLDVLDQLKKLLRKQKKLKKRARKGSRKMKKRMKKKIGKIGDAIGNLEDLLTFNGAEYERLRVSAMDRAGRVKETIDGLATQLGIE